MPRMVTRIGRLRAGPAYTSVLCNGCYPLAYALELGREGCGPGRIDLHVGALIDLELGRMQMNRSLWWRRMGLPDEILDGCGVTTMYQFTLDGVSWMSPEVWRVPTIEVWGPC